MAVIARATVVLSEMTPASSSTVLLLQVEVSAARGSGIVMRIGAEQLSSVIVVGIPPAPDKEIATAHMEGHALDELSQPTPCHQQ